MKNFFKGQSVVEYVIIFAVAVGAIVLGSIVFRGKLSTSYNKVSGKISQLVQGG